MNSAALILVYDDENSSRTYNIIFETYPPTGTVNDNPDTWIFLYDSSGGDLGNNDTGGTYQSDGYSRINFNPASPGTYYLLVWGNNTGPYALSVRTAGAGLRYFSNEVTSDPYEPDDSHAGNIPDSPVTIKTGGFSNRYSGNDDLDWFKIVLP